MHNLIAFLSVLPLDFLTKLSLQFFIYVIVVLINYMTQIKERTGICKSAVIATVVAIRDVVKNGFNYST